MAHVNILFSNCGWFSLEELQKNQLEEEVASYDGNRLLNTSVDDLCDYFTCKYSIDVPTLNKDAIVVEQREAKVDMSHDFSYMSSRHGRQTIVDGSAIELTVPFSGDPQLFDVSPTRFSMNPPRANVRGGALVLQFTGVSQSADQIRLAIDEALSSIETLLDRLRENADTFNRSLGSFASQLVEDRREKLLANKNLVASLGFALKENAKSPQTYTAPSVRRKLAPTRPPASSKPYKPEPSLADADYNHILDVVQNMAQVMELSPKSFKSMDEEALRTHFLVQLNGHYDGQATGETFNYEGKTDILIRQDGKNIFIGECKFWGGPKKLTETIDQLLRYSSWRDTKVAILVFNRNKNLTKVIEAAQIATVGHPSCKRAVGKQSETSFRYVFSHRDDQNRELTLTLLIFEVP